MKNLNLMFFLCIFMINTSYSQDEFLVLVNKKLNENEKIISALRIENAKLLSELKKIMSRANANENKLKNKLKELYLVNELLKSKENQIIKLLNELEGVKVKNKELEKAIISLKAQLKEVRDLNKSSSNYLDIEPPSNSAGNTSTNEKIEDKKKVEPGNLQKELPNQQIEKEESKSKLDEKIINKPIQDEPLLPSKSDNCYYLNVSSDLFGFRSRKLTQQELNACNQCQSLVYSDGRVEYDDMNKPSCKLKKKIDDETDLGGLANGSLVRLLNTEGSFFKVRDESTGKIGYIAAKYAGVSTLIKSSNCK